MIYAPPSAPLRAAGETLPPLLSLVRVFEDARACLSEAAGAAGLAQLVSELAQVDADRLREIVTRASLSERVAGRP